MKRLYTLLSIALLSLPVLACTNLLVSKGASKDGSVMVSYAADSHTRYGTLVFSSLEYHQSRGFGIGGDFKNLRRLQYRR